MNEQDVKTYIFTNKDLDNIDFSWLKNEGFKRISYDWLDEWWNSGFIFRLKDGKKLVAKIDCYNKEFTLESKKYGEFKISFLGKILADLMQDNDELYIINRELLKVNDEWSSELYCDIVNARFAELIFNKFNRQTDEIAKKIFKMIVDDKDFATITDYVKQED